MPGNVAAASASGVLPWEACSLFRRVERVETLENELPGGERIVNSLVTDSRRRWAIDRMATTSQASALLTFYGSHRGSAFFFYDVNDTVGCAYDATGTATTGRFKATFSSPIEMTVNVGYCQVSLEISEVA